MKAIQTSIRLAAACLTLAGSGVAVALPVSVSCPGTAATTDREFTITTDPGTATCLAYAVGNISGNGDTINQLGYLLLDKTDDATSGLFPTLLTATPPTSGLSGTFSFAAPSGYTSFVIAFKSGNGQLDPDWAAFTLPSGQTSGSWTISGAQQLSHVNLYARVAPVPLPAAVWLFGSGVIGLFAAARRRTRLTP